MKIPEGKLRKSFRLRRASLKRLELLKRSLHLNGQDTMALCIERFASRCNGTKPEDSKRAPATMKLLPHLTCKQLKVIAAHEACSETEALEKALLLTARELRLCK